MNGHHPEQDTSIDAALQASRERFEHAVDQLDVEAGNRLRLARRAAQSTTRRSRAGWLVPAGTALALSMLGLFAGPSRAPEPAMPAIPADSLEAGFPGDEEAEVYAWLGEAPVAVDPAKPGAL